MRMSQPPGSIHCFQVHLIVRDGSWEAAANSVLNWLAEWFLLDLGLPSGEYAAGSLLYYSVECEATSPPSNESPPSPTVGLRV